MAIKLGKAAQDVIEILKDPSRMAYIDKQLSIWLNIEGERARKLICTTFNQLRTAKTIYTVPIQRFHPENKNERQFVWVYCDPAEYDRLEQEKEAAYKAKEQAEDDERNKRRDELLERIYLGCDNRDQAKQIMRDIMDATQHGTINWPVIEKAQEKEGA